MSVRYAVTLTAEYEGTEYGVEKGEVKTIRLYQQVFTKEPSVARFARILQGEIERLSEETA